MDSTFTTCPSHYGSLLTFILHIILLHISMLISTFTRKTRASIYIYMVNYAVLSRPIFAYIYISLRLSVFDAYSICYIFPPVSLCVLSLYTPNLDFERGGCWRTRVTHDRRTVFSRTNARPWRELINSEIDRVKLTLFTLVGN